MKITFKDVGHGDTIVCQWTSDGKNKIGIIDCNKKRRRNPLIDFLKVTNIESIEFVIISHPHRDHFSGIEDLLAYCRDKNLNIKYFAHTATLHPAEVFFDNLDDKSVLKELSICQRH